MQSRNSTWKTILDFQITTESFLKDHFESTHKLMEKKTVDFQEILAISWGTNILITKSYHLPVCKIRTIMKIFHNFWISCNPVLSCS